MHDNTLPEVTITPKMLKLVSKLSKLEERFANLPLEKEWVDSINEEAIFHSTIAAYKLDGGRLNVTNQVDVPKLSKKRDTHIILNEIEVRKAFPIYFKDVDLSVEQLQYLHRFLDNLMDRESEERGKFRKSQKVQDLLLFRSLKNSMIRNGFMPRLLGDFIKEVNETYLHELIVGALVYIKVLQYAPFSRGNVRLARIFC